MEPEQPRYLPSPNAFDFLRAAGDALVNTGSMPAVNKPGCPIDPKRELVAANSLALQRARDALDFDYGDPSPDSFKCTWPHFARFRELAFLFRFEAQVREAGGDIEGATASRLDVMHAGALLTRNSVLVSMVVSIALQRVVMGDLWKSIPALDGPLSAAAARRMERIRGLMSPYREILLNDRRWSTNACSELFECQDWRRQLVASNAAIAVPKWVVSLVLRFTSEDTVQREMVDDWDRKLQHEAQPFGAPEPPLPRGASLYAKLCNKAGRGSDTRLMYAAWRAQNALLTVALALAAYWAQQSHYPKALDELAPAFLDEVPDDPFGNGAALRYIAKEGRYILYSLGPDLKDDGGTPIPGKVLRTRIYHNLLGKPKRTLVTAGPPGDIVAGVNVR
jgi:predicted nucleic acid-binding protein